MKRDPMSAFLPFADELICDNFAGGGGASTGIEQAFGRPIDIAINHDPEAIAMHKINHPNTKHYCESVFKIDPEEITGNQPVGLAWFSPDCTHHSKARGGKPRSQRVRGLAWVVIRWARRVKPRVIMLENVEEFADWGPLCENDQPIADRKGTTYQLWENQLRGAGYVVESKLLRACDFGAPTIRKRLFVIARRDGLPIVWPEHTHGADLTPHRTAAECIDWSIPCPSIFERKRPLAPNTLRRIARGIDRFVINAADPFIIPITHTGDSRTYDVREPLKTITCAPRGEFAFISPTLIQTGYGERKGQAPRVPGLHKPLGTVVAGGTKHALIAAFIAKHYTGVTGHGLRQPIGTITATDHHSLVTAFLCAYYTSTRNGHSIKEPARTITTKDRIGLVTVDSQQYKITDIGMRMLQPRELYTAQGFPSSYQIDFEFNGKPLTKTAQVRMCGNSVSPPVAAAVVKANFVHEQAWQVAA